MGEEEGFISRKTSASRNRSTKRWGRLAAQVHVASLGFLARSLALSPLSAGKRPPLEMGREVDLMSEDWNRFELHTTRRGETTCIALLGEFDLVGLDRLEAALKGAESRGGRPVLDLGGLKFTDSTGRSDDALGRDLVV